MISTPDPAGAVPVWPPATFGGRVRRALFGVSAAETDFDRRGFKLDDPAVRARFTVVVESFLAGYHAAIEDSDPGVLAGRLEAIDLEARGFAFEGAGMGLALLDRMSLGGRRFQRFAAGPGNPHEYMLYVGAGWAIARLGGFQRQLARIAPLRRYLAVDGLGFHEAFFHTAQAVTAQAAPRRLAGYALRAYDQGVGRCLWFVEGADPDRVARTIAGFAAPRHADLWAGAGLACTYAGGVPGDRLEALRAAAGPHGAHLAQGCAFAALARGRAGNTAPGTELACQVIWGRPAAEVHALARAAEQGLPEGESDPPAYETLRERIRSRFSENGAALRSALPEEAP